MNVRHSFAIHCVPVAFAMLLAAGTVMAAAPATPTPADPPAGVAPPPGELAFDSLFEHVGQHVRVTTTYGTIREGELTGASSIAINVKLDDRDIVLGMPKETIAKVELLPAAPAGDPQ